MSLGRVKEKSLKINVKEKEEE